MSSLVRCKACNYITRESKLGEVCPACGFQRSVFEPYEDKVSPRRRFLLNLDLHPILVHFPQAFVSMLPPLILANLLLPSFYEKELAVVTSFTALLLPLTTVGAFLSGLFDARIKLKRLSPPALIRKIAAGSALLLFSAVGGVIVALQGFTAETRIYVLLLSLASLACAVLLGMMGKRLIPVVLPG
ncbi:MAG: rubrerythrin [Candidatus Nealsonbacteria bacterium]|nr:rubrerythrin [Candidatus Nealsonbacteria bacterium]